MLGDAHRLQLRDPGPGVVETALLQSLETRLEPAPQRLRAAEGLTSAKPRLPAAPGELFIWGPLCQR